MVLVPTSIYKAFIARQLSFRANVHKIVMQALLDRLVPIFIDKLLKDYDIWVQKQKSAEYFMQYPNFIYLRCGTGCVKGGIDGMIELILEASKAQTLDYRAPLSSVALPLLSPLSSSFVLSAPDSSLRASSLHLSSLSSLFALRLSSLRLRLFAADSVFYLLSSSSVFSSPMTHFPCDAARL
ncbi:hypothetical protein Cgig2_019975 [Carnegiea gigantea]|uniref:Uncharacterized protein n=1 Tax=Carnegiea gigantea TaxID=171969 RepID=A0A9Q1K071_9CARY|nr:hypothetical protein Cgig2_019975 [Carnegiea gigantea]